MEKMTRYFVFFCITLCSCMSIDVKPELKVERDSIDIGTIRLHDSAKVIYHLSNAGDLPLQIKSIGTSCGCSEALLKDSTIQPGKSIELQVGFFAADTGRFIKHVVMETNSDPIYATLTFTGYSLRK